ncbi:uncharacterized protein LOC124170271 isoform X2 [Ischnura elegans]|uniref:uncharacterized protein LOC124170271 isoform X2 n=1 Tax=Ischnura elegans TaxID=197161 RepID=UPI001ED88242|nr:uncharacterized protein LOC124170271 isoform X2 [Ischnura elegans]
MEPSADLPTVKPMNDQGSAMEVVAESEVKPVAMDVEANPSADVSDAAPDAHALPPAVKVENGGQSQFPSELCAEEGLAGRIGLVELSKGSSDSENGKGGTLTKPSAAPSSAPQPSSSCMGTDGCIIPAPTPHGHKDDSNVEGASKEESVVGNCGGGEAGAIQNGACANDTVDEAPEDNSKPRRVNVVISPSCHSGDKEELNAESSSANIAIPPVLEKVPSTEDSPVLAPGCEQGTNSGDVGVKGTGAEPCALRAAAEESACPERSAKKRRVECSGSDAEVGKSKVEDGEVAGDHWRKRRRRKSRRKALNACASASSISSSEDERENPRRAQEARKQRAEDDTAAVSEDEQQFCLRWNNFLTNITSQFGTLRDDEDFVDVTLACGGMHVKAHRVVLSACSPYFKRMFKSVPYCQHPVVFLEGIEPSHLLSLLAFMYCGEVGVGRGQLPSLLSAAHALQVRGLTEMGSTAGKGGSDGEEEEEQQRVIVSARRQAMAVEKVLKDIGFSEVSGAGGGCALNLPKSVAVSGEQGASSRHQRPKESLTTEGLLSNGLGEPFADGPCARGAVRGTTGAELSEGEMGRCSERRVRWSSTKLHPTSSPSSLRTPLLPEDADEILLPSPCANNKGTRERSRSLLNCTATTSGDSANKVNHAERLLMAASLVDVRIASSPAGPNEQGEDDCADRARELREPPSNSLSSRTSPAPDAQGTNGMERHGWDPGEGDELRGTPFEPRIDLVMGGGLITPKQEFPPFGDDVDDISLPNAIIEPKMERQDEDADCEDASCGGVVQLAAPAPSAPTLSLVTLGSPIVGVIAQQQQPRPGPSSSSSHVFSHFLPPMAPPSQHHRLSPTAPNLSDGPGRRGGGTTTPTGGEVAHGHLKWEMPRPCPVCRRIYSNNSNLRRHLRTIHEDYYEAHMQ